MASNLVIEKMSCTFWKYSEISGETISVLPLAGIQCMPQGPPFPLEFWNCSHFLDTWKSPFGGTSTTESHHLSSFLFVFPFFSDSSTSFETYTQTRFGPSSYGDNSRIPIGGKLFGWCCFWKHGY